MVCTAIAAICCAAFPSSTAFVVFSISPPITHCDLKLSTTWKKKKRYIIFSAVGIHICRAQGSAAATEVNGKALVTIEFTCSRRLCGVHDRNLFWREREEHAKYLRRPSKTGTDSLTAAAINTPHKYIIIIIIIIVVKTIISYSLKVIKRKKLLHEYERNSSSIFLFFFNLIIFVTSKFEYITTAADRIQPWL